MSQNPYLHGAYAPIDKESEFVDLEVIGELPADLSGVYVRNGPNPRFEPKGLYHWFDGDGMLHGVHIADGKVSYRNRWIRTAHADREAEADESLWMGIMESTRDNPKDAPYKDTSNTDVKFHRDSLLTSWYVAGDPYRVDPITLETRGGVELESDRPLHMSAHMKVDEQSGELMFFDYGPRPPFMTYGVLEPDGELSHLTAIDLPGPRLPHDMAITERYSILMDLPVYFRPEALKARKWMVDFHRDKATRFGVLPRRAEGSEVRWFEAEPCYVYHTINAWESGDEIVMVGCRCDDPIPTMNPDDGVYARMMANLRLRARLYEWRMNLATGQLTERYLDDRNVEFPTLNEQVLGRRSRFAYAMHIPAEPTLLFDGIVRYDTDTGAAQHYSFGEGCYGSEAPFAPAIGSTNEGRGYLLSFVHDCRAARSELRVLDAENIEAGPIARVPIPQRVPLGFHATWVAGDALP